MTNAKPYEEREPAIDIARRSEFAGELRRPKISAVDNLPTVEDMVEALGPAVSDIAASRADKINRLRAHALASASLAREIGNHPLHAWSPMQAGMLWNMADMLTVIMDEKPGLLPEAYRKTSSAADLLRTNAVADAIKGEDAA